MGGVDLASIVAGAYDAALQDDLWTSWAEQFFHALGGSGGLFGLHNTEERSLSRIVSIVAPARAVEEYVQGYSAFDPQVPLVSALPASGVYMGVPDAPSHRKEVVDYLRWQDDVAQMPHHQTAVLTLGEAPCRASICVHKTRELGPVTADEHRTLRRLVTELEPAFQLAFRHNEMLTSAFWDGIVVGRSDQMAFLIDEADRRRRGARHHARRGGHRGAAAHRPAAGRDRCAPCRHRAGDQAPVAQVGRNADQPRIGPPAVHPRLLSPATQRPDDRPAGGGGAGEDHRSDRPARPG